MSSYLCEQAKVYELLDRSHPPNELPRALANSLASQRPRVWMAHGARDGFVLPQWGEATSEKLREAGLEVEWQTYAGLRHSLRQDELEDLSRWMAPIVLPGLG